jgi:hypothetical protein
MSNPFNPKVFKEARLGSLYPLKRKKVSRIKPAVVCLNAAINKGGKDFTPILIAKKVVPQKMETAAKANQAKNLGDLNKWVILFTNVATNCIRF